MLQLKLTGLLPLGTSLHANKNRQENLAVVNDMTKMQITANFWDDEVIVQEDAYEVLSCMTFIFQP